MRTRVLSDLHLEFMEADERSLFIESIPTDCDVLVLAGDVDGGASLHDTLRAFADRFRHVVYVLGNHEFYGTSVAERLDAIRYSKHPENFHWLENTSRATHALHEHAIATAFARSWSVPSRARFVVHR